MGQDTLAKVESILKRVRLHPEYSDRIGQKTVERIRKEAYRHSSALETNPDEHTTTKAIEEFKTNSYRGLSKARRLLRTEGITPYSLSCLGNILEPGKNPYKQFRTRDVGFGSFEGAPTPHIHGEVDDLIWRINDVSIHPIRRAEDAHVSLVNTHPYFDGNGRAARLLQDICLESHGYPAGIIPSDEREKYIHLMNGAVEDRRSGKSSVYNPSLGEGLFQDFVDEKILRSAQELEADLRRTRFYEVVFTGKKNAKSLKITLRNRLRGNSSNPLLAHLYKSGGRKTIALTISGDIGREELSQRVSKLSEQYGMKYTCVPKKH